MRLRFVAALGLTLTVGCYDPVAPLGDPCGPMGECPSGQQCDEITHTCLSPTELRMWRDDTAADFNQTGAVLTNATVEANGAVGPVAYATGRVKLSAVEANLIPNAATTKWADVDQPRVGTGFIDGLDIDYAAAAPQGLGTSKTDNITVLVEAEIQLDAPGTWLFKLTANDAGFVDIAAPGADFQRLVSDTFTGTQVTYNAPAAGWYRIRGAFSDANLNMAFTLAMRSPMQNGGVRTITSDQVRVRVDDLTGYLFDGFDDSYLMGYQGSTLLTQPLELSLGADPYGITIGVQTYSIRTGGEFLIDTEGDYGFVVSTHHGHRVWLDGTEVANAFVSSDQVTNISPVHLVPGWHDITIDTTKSGDTANVTLSMKVTTGPTWVGQTIPIDHVRPVPPRKSRFASAHDASSTAITDAASITRTISMFVPANAVPSDIIMNYSFTHSLQAQVGIVLDPPSGSNITVVSTGALTGSGNYPNHQAVPTADAGSTWSLIASDNTADAITGTLDDFSVTILYDGGTEPFPRTYRYESAPKELGNVVGIGALTWRARQGAVKVQIRTCDDAASCAGETWVDVAASGDTPAITPKPFAQYAVDFTGDGDTPTALDWIELAYTARP